MNWFSLVSKFLASAPAIIATVEALHKMKDSSTKQEMARTALIAAHGLSDVFTTPEQKPLADAVSNYADKAIDFVVDSFNTVGLFTHKDSPAPAPAAQAQAAVAAGEARYTVPA